MSRDDNRPVAVDKHGQVMAHAGKYAKGAVLTVFEQLGGVSAMTEWARENKTTFYTKLFPKVIDREPPQQSREDNVEDLLEALDREMIDVTPDPDSPAGDEARPETHEARPAAQQPQPGHEADPWHSAGEPIDYADFEEDGDGG